MRFIVMHKVDATMEAGGPPSQTIIREMGAHIGESLKAGVFLDGAGLHRSAARVKLLCANGPCTVVHGPFSGTNELVAGLVMVRARSMDDAIEHARELAAAGGDPEIEIGPVVEAWDLGYVPKPEVIESSRFLLVRKGTRSYEAGQAEGAAARQAVAGLLKRWHDEGVLLKVEKLAPTVHGKRLPSAAKARRTWIDGPFAESKELIAGFSILEMASIDDVVPWADRYGEILGDNEIDIRVLEEPA